MEFFLNWNFSLAEIILLAVLGFSFFYEIIFYFRIINIVFQKGKEDSKNYFQNQQEIKPVSIIICAKDETENLRKYLPEVLNQDYPEYEVIVVNDGCNEDSAMLINEFRQDFAHLKYTFVPAGTTNISTKKLAITLGIKAAKYEWLLFTDADCMPDSKNWITEISKNFNSGVEFVLGFSPYMTEKSWINKLITYDTLFNGLQYLGYAAHGKPYMGVGRNMAYKKEIFFRNNGFASSLHLRSGDDDLMVNHAAHAYNTRIVTSSDSFVWSKPEKNYKNWYFQKKRHLSVSSWYKNTSKFVLFTEPFFRGLYYLSFLLLTGFSVFLMHLNIASIAVFLFLFRFITQSVIINRSSKHFKGRKYFGGLIVFDVLLPLISLWILTFGKLGKRSKVVIWK